MQRILEYSLLRSDLFCNLLLITPENKMRPEGIKYHAPLAYALLNRGTHLFQ